MSDPPAGGLRSHVTLILCTILHAFTHAYGTLLVPLYLLMVSDLKLTGVSRNTLKEHFRQLVEKGYLSKQGGGRSTWYVLT